MTMGFNKPGTNGTMVTFLAAFALVLCIFTIKGLAAGADHYCSQGTPGTMQIISAETEGSIYTRYQGDVHYRNNQNCVWLIDAGPGNRVELTVNSSDLQWAPESAICPGYDHVAIKDVNSTASQSADPGEENGKESIVLQWCGHRKPLGAVSSGRYLKVEFMSDKNNPYQYTGVHLQFKTFSATDCAPSWHTSPTNYCFKLLAKETDWSTAQRECNAENANLASIVSEGEHRFVVQNYSQVHGLVAWIGLNDIVDVGSYHWIDESDFAFDKFSPDHAANQYTRCVSLNFKEEAWKVQDCEDFEARPLCKSKKGTNTKLFPIPQEREEDYKMPVGMMVGIILAVVALVILVLTGVILYCRMKAGRCKSNYRAPRQASDLSDAPSNTRQQGIASAQRGAANNRGGGARPTAPPVDSTETQTPQSDLIAPPPYEEVVGGGDVAVHFKAGAYV